jgi:hypothetical protein
MLRHYRCELAVDDLNALVAPAEPILTPHADAIEY